MRRLVCLLSCAAVVMLAACSDPQASPPPEQEESVGATSESPEETATSSPDDAVETTSPTAADREDPGVPELPPEAMEDTEAGAEAFVQYYIDLLNYTGKFPQSGLLEPFGGSGCATCDVLEDETTDLETESNRYEVDSLRTDTIEALPFESGYRVQLRGEAIESSIVGASGDAVARTEAVPDLAWAIQLSFEANGFSIEWIKSVEA